MIQNVKHKGLRLLHEKGDRSRLRPDIAMKATYFLTLLDNAEEIQGMDWTGYNLHRLTGDMAGLWSVSVSRNYRIVFRFEGGHAYDVDLIDYH